MGEPIATYRHTDGITYRLDRVAGRKPLHIIWTQPGKGTQRISTGTEDERQAQVCFRDYIRGLDAPPDDNASLTVADCLDYYLAKFPKTGTRRQVRLRQNRINLSKAVREHFGTWHPSEITDKTLEPFIEKRRAAGRRPSTIRSEVEILRTAFRYLEKQTRGRQDRAPFFAPSFALPPASPPRERWLTKEEAAKLLDSMTGHWKRKHLYLFTAIGLCTAARPGAILDLTWDRVHWNVGAHGQIDFRNPNRPTFTRKMRAVVPMNKRLRETLEAAYAELDDERRKGHVITYCGRPIESPVGVWEGFVKAVERAGIPPATPYTLRHTAATWAAMAGVPLDKIAEMLGDKIETVRKHYAKFQPEYLKEATEALEF